VTARALVRAVHLPGALAVNAISMIGIGPLITIPLVLGALHGPLSLAGWLLGALLACCDGLVFAELGSAFPRSGGTYGYLLAVFGRAGAGRLLAFLYVWQVTFSTPLVLASGYVGFANYAGYLYPPLASSPWGIKALAIGVGIVTLLALYRGIVSIARTGIVLGIVAVVTLLFVAAGAFAHFSPHLAWTLAPGDSLWSGLRAGLGQALVIAMYDYSGYGTANNLGDEVVDPAKTLPRSILLAVALVAALYVAMQAGILGALPWASYVPLQDGTLPPLGQHLGAAVVELAFGKTAAVVATLLVLVTAFASVYGGLLGASRIPYAAASDGNFLRPFAHVDERKRFPDVSLVALGILALAGCLFTLQQLIDALTAAGTLIASIVQMFPLPALLALTGWIYVFCSSGLPAIGYGLATLAAGGAVYALTLQRAAR
jgi:amino acid transporter